MKNIFFSVERRLKMRVGSQTREITLTLRGLTRVRADAQRAECWACQWVISDIHPAGGNIYGEDPLQSLTNCLAFVRKIIHNEKEAGRAIWWLDEGDDGGL